MRRELQEARASRNLAENHAAKCVNFPVSRSVTPVTFDTPCITSTPVRTALADTRSLPPVLPSATSTSSHTSSSSALRSRSAEVAALLLSEVTDRCQNSGPVSCEDSPRSKKKNESDRSETTSAPCRTAAISATEVGLKREIVNENSDLIIDTANCKDLWEVDMTELAAEEKSSMTNEEAQTNLLTAAEGQAGDQLSQNREEITRTESLTERDETKTSVSPDAILEERKDVANGGQPSEDRTSKERSVDHAIWQRLCNSQRGSCKKSRWKKSELKWFSETDESKNPHRDAEVLVDATSYSSSTGTNCDTVNESGSCPNGDHTNRAITEVPEVAVVGGGSIMPKDLCSTGPLTSRTKTAPSRATYTTAYI